MSTPEFKEFDVVVLGIMSIPLFGEVNGHSQIENCRSQKNYLVGESTVTVIEEKEVRFKPYDTNNPEGFIPAYRISGVDGWFSAKDFKLTETPAT